MKFEVDFQNEPKTTTRGTFQTTPFDRKPEALSLMKLPYYNYINEWQ